MRFQIERARAHTRRLDVEREEQNARSRNSICILTTTNARTNEKSEMNRATC